jgi:hypothetical protein
VAAPLQPMHGMYAWQVSETSITKGGPTGAEVTEAGPGKDVGELRETGYAQLDDNGNQADLVGQSSASEK